MNELFIMRHGKAEDPSESTGWSDRPRRLTGEGIQRIQAMIPAMLRLGFVPDLVVSSPYPRAAETAQIVHEGVKVARPLEFDDTLGADQSVFSFFENQISKYLEASNRFMVVGHEPILSQLASLLISGNVHTRIHLKKGAIIHLECGMLGKEVRGMLKGFWSSRQLRALGGD